MARARTRMVGGGSCTFAVLLEQLVGSNTRRSAIVLENEDKNGDERGM